MGTWSDRLGVTVGARVHGGLVDAELRELGLRADEIVDFSVNTNPYGPSREMVRALAAASVDRYPDVTGRAAREALGAALALPASSVVLGAGAADLLWTIARLFLRPGDRVAIVEPTFCEFRAAALACGAEIAEWRAQQETSFAVDLNLLDGLVETVKPRCLYLCAPNTPTGAAVPIERIREFAFRHPEVLVVLDQSFLSMSERCADLDEHVPENVVRVRSLTKDHAIPGIRVGYALASAEIVDGIERSRPSWTTSGAAQAAVHVACRSEAFIRESREAWLGERRWLEASLMEVGMRPFPTSTGFLLVEADDPAALRRRLLAQQRVLVRDATSFGLPRHVRICARTRTQNERLMAALRR